MSMALSLPASCCSHSSFSIIFGSWRTQRHSILLSDTTWAHYCVALQHFQREDDIVVNIVAPTQHKSWLFSINFGHWREKRRIIRSHDTTWTHLWLRQQQFQWYVDRFVKIVASNRPKSVRDNKKVEVLDQFLELTNKTAHLMAIKHHMRPLLQGNSNIFIEKLTSFNFSRREPSRNWARKSVRNSSIWVLLRITMLDAYLIQKGIHSCSCSLEELKWTVPYLTSKDSARTSGPEKVLDLIRFQWYQWTTANNL